MDIRHLRRLVAAALLAAAGAVPAQTLRWASQGDLQTLDPHSQNELLTKAVNGQVYDTLVTRDKQLGIAPALATEWTMVNPTLWRVKLRSGVRFHDGSAFTADDVVFSVQRAQHAASPFRAYAMALGTPRKLDELTVEFTLASFNPIWLQHATTIYVMPRAWTERHHAATPLDFKNKDDKHTNLNANGTGPFILVSRQPDTRTVFRRNPNYWGRIEGNVQEVVYTPIKSDATRTAALISGEALTPIMRSRGEGGVGYYNWGNFRNPRLDELAVASGREPDPARREQLIKAALKEHNEQVHHIPLHRQVIPWAARSNVNVVHRADNWLEWQWVIAVPR
jgi:ABC-type transport system substrate-binding protein